MSANQNMSPQTLRRLMQEIRELTQTPPEGVRLEAGDGEGGDLTEIGAVIVGPAGTPYEGGEFRMRLKMGNDFPQAPPKGYFVTKIFHPNVSKSGEICVNTLKKDWKESLGIKHILLTIKCLLIVPNPESALNEEAGKLLLEKYDDYARHARLMTSIHAQPAAGTAAAVGAGDDDDDALLPAIGTTAAASCSASSSSSSSSSSSACCTTATATGDADAAAAPSEDTALRAKVAPAAAVKKPAAAATAQKRSLKRL